MTSTLVGSQVLLGGYPAKQCAMRTHHEHDPALELSPEVSAAVRARMDEGISFEDDLIVPALVEALGQRCVVVEYGDHRADKARRIAETTAAMDAGVEVIVGGQLPDDYAGSRTGSPDVLFRVTPAGHPNARYVPGDVKHHGTLKAGGRAARLVSGLGDGFDRVEVTGFTHSTHRAGDSMQLAHYTRMLEAAGRHPGPHMRVGAILGTTDFTDLTGDRFGFVWYDLNELTEKTWTSDPVGSVKRSIMDVYDHAFDLRVRVARAARAGAEPVVRPFGKAECGECPFAPVCRDLVGPTDASFAVTKGQLTDREWLYLYAQGAGTVDGLAGLGAEGDLLAGYLGSASHLPQPEKRLAAAMDRARMVRDRIAFERSSGGPVVVPSADVEIDFDVEWDTNGHVYQWGVRVRYDQDESTATYEHTAVSFDPLDEVSAAALAEGFFAWFEAFVAEHEAAGRSVAVYHWTNPETSRTATALGQERSDRLFARRFLDLKTWMAPKYVARDGFGLKVVAPVFGFAWSVDDAGGALSMVKVDEARNHPDPQVRAQARQWLMDYNESDCAAQAAVRDGLRASAGAATVHDLA